MRAVFHLALMLVLAAPALGQTRPHPALIELIPLTDVYDARRGGAPGFDVAGIRCAAFTRARDLWARETPGYPRVAASDLREAETNLAASEIDRRQRLRMGAARAAASTRDDAQRLIGLYLARFRANRQNGRHPWQGDPVLDRDTTYCGFLAARR